MEFVSIINYKPRKIVNVIRFSGEKLLIPESLPDHISDMISLALFIHNEYYKKYGDESILCIKDLIYRIALHDFDESLYCDIPRNFKYDNVELNDAINDTVNRFIDKNFNIKIADDIKSAKDSHTLEGLLVKLLDVSQCSLVLYREVIQCNNNLMLDVLTHNLIILEEVIQYSYKFDYQGIEIIQTYLKTIKSQIENDLRKR